MEPKAWFVTKNSVPTNRTLGTSGQRDNLRGHPQRSGQTDGDGEGLLVFPSEDKTGNETAMAADSSLLRFSSRCDRALINRCTVVLGWTYLLCFGGTIQVRAALT